MTYVSHLKPEGLTGFRAGRCIALFNLLHISRKGAAQGVKADGVQVLDSAESLQAPYDLLAVGGHQHLVNGGRLANPESPGLAVVVND